MMNKLKYWIELNRVKLFYKILINDQKIKSVWKPRNLETKWKLENITSDLIFVESAPKHKREFPWNLGTSQINFLSKDLWNPSNWKKWIKIWSQFEDKLKYTSSVPKKKWVDFEQLLLVENDWILRKTKVL